MVGKYKFNTAIDSFRLIRGILAPKYADPYIEKWPQRISSRRNLFQWKMVENEVGRYDNDYSGYQPFRSSQPLLMQYLPERYSRDAYQHLLRSKEYRISQITDLLVQSGVRVEANDDAWRDIFQWLEKQFVPSKEPAALTHEADGYFEFHTRPIVYSLISDLGLLLGDHAIQLRPEFQWIFWGDVPMKNPAALGREPWILCEPLPTRGRFKERPIRFLPMKLVRMAASSSADSTPNSSEQSRSAGILTHLCG